MKKIIIMMLSLVISLQVSASFAKDFPDVDNNHWAYKEIQKLETDQVVVGYPDGYFRPNQSASRAEFATMTVKALRQENCNLDKFYYYRDVPREHWAFENIEKAHYFDLISGYPTEYFRPLENITRLDAVKMMVASVETSNISESRALESLSTFTDLGLIPIDDRIAVGKAKILGIIVNSPDKKDLFEPERPITRAEISYSLYNMRKQALLRPNSKLKEAMMPKYADGFIINNVEVKDNIATIPAGTLIPAILTDEINSQKNTLNSNFFSTTKYNLVTKEKYFLIPEKSLIIGSIIDVVPAKYFVRNAKITLCTDSIAIYTKPKASFDGHIDILEDYQNWFKRFINFIVKGRKIQLKNGQDVMIQLAQPIKVDITNQTIIKE
jgi:hypothetical protein